MARRRAVFVSDAGRWGMAEPMTQPDEGIVAEQDALVATKLYVPLPRPGFIARPRLADRLAEGSGGALTLVSAPAGFGKTALLAHWARGLRRPVAWLSLDGGDNDPARFWRYVAAAMDVVRPGVAGRVEALLGAAPQPPVEGLVTVLVNALVDLPDEAILVVDDYHLIESRSIHEGLLLLLERRPPPLRLVVASRVDPPLALARLRARGQLVELRAAELRFTPEETAALLGAATGLELPPASLAALQARTEGWAAGLQLAGLSLRGRSDPAGFLAGFSGSHRFVLDYLAEEVLDRQPGHLRTFLLETSVLSRLCGELCDAVTGRTDGQALLEQVERANLFLVPLDEERRWWRYHHLFADLLRARLERERPERLPALHRNAATWCEGHGLVDDAIGHAVAAGDPGWAAQLIERHAEEDFQRGEGATVLRWLRALPVELVRVRPQLSLATAIAVLVEGRSDPAAIEPLLVDAERAPATDEPYQPSVGRVASLLANVPAATAVVRAHLGYLRRDAEATAAFARQAQAQLTEVDRSPAAFADWYLAMADWLDGRLAEAEQALVRSVAERQATTGPERIPWPSSDLGAVQHARGRLSAAVGTFEQALAVDNRTGRLHPLAGLAHIGVAGVLYERDQLDTALDHLTEGVEQLRQLGWAPGLASGLAWLALVRQAQGDDAGALAAVAQADRAMPGAGVFDARVNPLPALRAWVLLAQGRIDEAAGWARERGLGEEDPLSYQREREYLVFAQVLLATGAAHRARRLLERLQAAAAAQDRTGSRIEILALQALALRAGDDEDAALAALASALELGWAEGYVRVFVDLGAPMAALFGRLASGKRSRGLPAGVPGAYLRRLAAGFEQHATPSDHRARRVPVVVPGLIEQLSQREFEVLLLMAAGRSNREIADELVVVVDTAKKHVGRVMDKLGAANRTQAVARARELGLLS
jgi:LuxR family transcriptional regulator, maltose regulon positive regulatory protein